MKIIGVKTNRGYFITCERSVFSLIINGEIPKETFHNKWGLVTNEPVTVEKAVHQPNINHRFELIPDSPWIGKTELPKVMPKAEVMEGNDGGYCGWKEEFKHLQSLYEEKSDSQPDKIENVEFEYETILEIPEVKIADGFSYMVQSDKSLRHETNQLSEERIKNQLIDQIVFPAIALPSLPCRLSSHDSYKIIREHVRNNVIGKYARVTSDFNFCFTVKKNIVLNDPVHMKNEITNAQGKSYAKRRYREWLVKDREVEVFEMTYSPHNYKGYTPIRGFVGTDHQDLKKNIDLYLENLMARLNEPLTDCSHCNGLGVVLEDGGNGQ